MTIATTTSKITHLGNGSTTIFSFPFVGVSQNDLVVTYTNTSGVSVILSPSLYTVAINSIPVNGLWGVGGFVTYPNTGSPPTPITAGTTFTIERAVPYEQDVSIGNQGAFYPQAVEQGLDLLELQLQQLHTLYLYALKTPITDFSPPNDLPSATLRAGGYLTFHATTGQPTVTFVTPSSTGPTTFGNPRKVIVTGVNILTVTTTDSWGGVCLYQNGVSTTTVQLPATGGPYPIFDGGLSATAYPITVLPPAGKTINGAVSYTMKFNGSSATFYIDSSGQVFIG